MIGREACVGEHACFTLGSTVFEVLSPHKVEMPYGFMNRSDGCFLVQTEGKARGMGHLPSVLSQGLLQPGSNWST